MESLSLKNKEIGDLCRKIFNTTKSHDPELFGYSVLLSGKIFVDRGKQVHIDKVTFTELPITFNETIGGYIHISSAYKLTTLEGVPTESIETLGVQNVPNLKSLKGSPKSATYFYVNGTGITNLVGGPREVKFYSCSENQLTSLEGAPENVEYFCCSKNPLKDLKGAPKKIENYFGVRDCPNLTSLEGMPKMIDGYLDLSSCYSLYDPSPLKGSSFRELKLFRCPIKSLYNLFHKSKLSDEENIKNFIDSLDYNYIRVLPDSERVFLNYFRLNEALSEFDIPISTVRDIPNFAYEIVDDRGWPVEIKPDWDERPPHL